MQLSFNFLHISIVILGSYGQITPSKFKLENFPLRQYFMPGVSRENN
jgi:hypothetical protein